MQSSPLSFLARKIAPHLAEIDGVPLFGQAPFFDWKRYSTLLSDRLFLNEFSIDLKEQRMLERSEILQGLGPHPEMTPILLSPLPTPLFWVMSRADLETFTSALLKGETGPSPFSSQVLQEGYYRYLLLEMLDAAKELDPMNQLTPQLSEEVELPEESAFCVDVQLSFSYQKCWGRIVLPLSMKRAFVKHFAHLPYAPVAADRAREVELLMGVQIGSVHLDLNEWKTLRPGDALFLDRNSYNPKKGEGVATLTLGSIPVFQARVEPNRLTIIEYAFYYEETMEGQKNPQSIAETKSENEEVLAIQNYPLAIVVELGRVRITLEQLMRLSAGNMLELPIQPDQGVSLTVNGRLIGRGEVVSFGNALAVRILEIAS